MTTEKQILEVSSADGAGSVPEPNENGRRAHSGNTNLIDETYRAEFESLHGILCRLKHHRLMPEEAQEALQNAFVVLAERQRRDRFWPSNVRSWLIRVAVIQARRLNRHPLVSLDSTRRLNDSFAGQLAAVLSDSESKGPGTALLEGEMLHLLREALGHLPEESRRIIEAHVVDGVTFPIIARASGISEENAKKICQRGLGQIRERLGRYSSSMVGGANANTYKPRTRKGILEAFHTLPRPYAEILEARYSTGLPLEQCAVLAEITVQGAEERLGRAQELMNLKYGMTPAEMLGALRGSE